MREGSNTMIPFIPFVFPEKSGQMNEVASTPWHNDKLKDLPWQEAGRSQ